MTIFVVETEKFSLFSANYLRQLQPRSVLNSLVLFFLKKWAKPGLFLFIFVLFKYKFYIKTVCCSGIRTWIVGKEGELADHLTITTTQCRYLLFKGRQNYNIKSLVRISLCGIGSYNKILQRNFKLDLSNSKNNYYF